MSIEKLTEIALDNITKYQRQENVNLNIFFEEVINTFKDQSDMIADLRKELAQKEDVITLSEIKEVSNLANNN